MVRLTRYNISTRKIRTGEAEEHYETYFTERPDGEVVMARDVAALEARHAEIVVLVGKALNAGDEFSDKDWDRLRELIKETK